MSDHPVAASDADVGLRIYQLLREEKSSGEAYDIELAILGQLIEGLEAAVAMSPNEDERSAAAESISAAETLMAALGRVASFDQR